MFVDLRHLLQGAYPRWEGADKATCSVPFVGIYVSPFLSANTTFWIFVLGLLQLPRHLVSNETSHPFRSTLWFDLDLFADICLTYR